LGHARVEIGDYKEARGALAKADALGGKRRFGPDTIMGGMILGQFSDPEGHIVGLIQSAAS